MEKAREETRRQLDEAYARVVERRHSSIEGASPHAEEPDFGLVVAGRALGHCLEDDAVRGRFWQVRGARKGCFGLRLRRGWTPHTLSAPRCANACVQHVFRKQTKPHPVPPRTCPDACVTEPHPPLSRIPRSWPVGVAAWCAAA